MSKPETEKIIGIDLGTTNSAAAVMEAGRPLVVPSAEGQTAAGKMFPSVVAFTKEGQMIVGEPAIRQEATNPEGTIREIKRKMGSGDYKVRIYGKEYSPRPLQRQPAPGNKGRRRNRRLPSRADNQRAHRSVSRLWARQGRQGDEDHGLQLRRRNTRRYADGVRRRSLPSPIHKRRHPDRWNRHRQRHRRTSTHRIPTPDRHKPPKRPVSYDPAEGGGREGEDRTLHTPHDRH